MSRILVVDDERSMREFLKILLEKEKHSVETAADGSAALKYVSKDDFDLVITDIRMPVMDGLTFLAEAKQLRPELPVIMITAFASPEDAVKAMQEGAFDYITKPFKVEEINRVVSTATSRKTPLHEQTDTEDHFPEIIGQSPEMVKIYDLIKRIGPTPANVLIYGESGTGKELVAKAIHRLSSAKNQPFVPITCSAIPESLLESELFGHVKGSFTGAVSNKEGLFQLADGGTAFLDEIGELTPIIQTKLLRVLQEREFMPVGSTKTRKINVRIIAATNRELEKDIVDGRFREDLYYRLAVVPIRVPSLRERRGDVPLLVNHFLEKYSRLLGKDVQTISSYGLKVLMEYDFPGNVRELENIIERGVALESSTIILPDSLKLSSHRQREAHGSDPLFVAAGDEAELLERGLDDILASLEKRIIEYALAKTDNSKMRAAELLKISFRSLRYKTKKYGID